MEQLDAFGARRERLRMRRVYTHIRPEGTTMWVGTDGDEITIAVGSYKVAITYQELNHGLRGLDENDGGES